MSFIYAFYLDVFLFRNLIVNESILLLAFQLTNLPVKKYIVKIIVSGIVGTIITTGILLVVRKYVLYLFLSTFIVIPIISYAVIRRIKFILFSLITAILIGGIGMAIENTLNIKGYIYSIILCQLVIVLLQKYLKVERGRFLFQLNYNDKSYRGFALYDTGNCLKTTVEQKMVHVADEEVIRYFELSKEYERISYKSVGTSAGELSVYKLDSLIVWKRNEKIQYDNPFIGCVKEGIIDVSKYQIILNEGVFYESS